MEVASTMPQETDEAPRPGVSARRRTGTAALVGVAAGALSGLLIPWTLTPLVTWDVAALVYVSAIWIRVWKLDARQTARHAAREDPTRAAADVLILAAAAASLIAVGYVIVRAGSGGGLVEGVQVGFGVASVIVSWSVIHTVYAVRYARLYYSAPTGGSGADFHQTDKPRYSDFAYLAFTVGMTFQVSDTELNSGPFRAVVLRHALMSYLFGTVIVALTINLVAGLSR
jgi:uncharacterized membrane protein